MATAIGTRTENWRSGFGGQPGFHASAAAPFENLGQRRHVSVAYATAETSSFW